ncbi:hypothetical protein DHW03_01620 [Pedobacter yonginense]|uniref:MotA/TolQ/ExbB proton channel domain-containing protein n=1 Tax=Pedobacter yonginense TaxID=651869 RepID=A0A317ETU9_9SPHI|nr:hypothetical protein [Pedobacter yonginense]PWS28578.1 hypothetical protein DHW03_01620 [Pedobacter yonginense]
MMFLEGISLIIIASLQFYFFSRSITEVAKLSNFFPSGELGLECIGAAELNGQKIDQLVFEHKHSEFKSVVLATNAYLYNNVGSADFNIIKSIADRTVSSQEEKISSTLSLPLYFGLMGTFIGVILGLGSIALNGFNLQDTDHLINQLVTGVVMAMVVSFLGLALTTVLNAFLFRNAVAQRDVNRNHYLNFLQAKLLPNLDNNLYAALDQFKLNIADFNVKFSKNLDFFDSSFNENIKNLKGTVEGMSGQIVAVNENMSVQLEFLQELRKIGYNRMAEANIRVFDKIKESGPLLVNFIREQQKLTENLEQANNFGSRVAGLMDRVASFEDGINNLGRELQQSDLLGGNLINIVKKHLHAIEQKEHLVNDYAARSNSEVESYLSSGLERIKTLKNKIEIDFEKAFDFHAEGNLMQNLNYLKEIDGNILKLNLNLEQKNDAQIISKLDQLVEIMQEKEVSPSPRSIIPSTDKEDDRIEETAKKESKWWRVWGKNKAA